MQEQARVVNDAVQKSNEHADKSIGQVRQDVNALANSVQGITRSIAQSTSSISASIGNIKAPEAAHLEFVFGHPLAETRVLNVPLVLGVTTVEFSVRVSGKVAAQHGALWVACSGCQFKNLSGGWSYVGGANGNPAIVNGGEFHDLYVGVNLPPMKLDIVPPVGVRSFELAFAYACQNCPGLDLKKAQILTVNTVMQ